VHSSLSVASTATVRNSCPRGNGVGPDDTVLSTTWGDYTGAD
jgi:hypothetical protein